MHNRALQSARAPGVGRSNSARGRSKAPGFLAGRFVAPDALLLWEMEKLEAWSRRIRDL